MILDWKWTFNLTVYADPESFVKGGGVNCDDFFSWWGEGWAKYHYKRVIIGLQAKRHLNGVSLV